MLLRHRGDDQYRTERGRQLFRVVNSQRQLLGLARKLKAPFAVDAFLDSAFKSLTGAQICISMTEVARIRDKTAMILDSKFTFSRQLLIALIYKILEEATALDQRMQRQANWVPVA